MIRIALFLFAVVASACSGGSPSNSSPDLSMATADDRFLGHWPSCTFGRRLQFTTPSGTPDRAMTDIAGSLDVTDNGDGTIKLTPSATGINTCGLDFTRNGYFGNIVPNQVCIDAGLALTFAPNSDVDVSTLELAASFVVSFDGTIMAGQPASGTGGGVYHCNAR